MRIVWYSINVLLIQILGRINVWLFPYKTSRLTVPDRLCYSEYGDNGDGFGAVTHISCCDCGASHHFWKANGGIYGIPIRPEGYEYRPRLHVDTVFADPDAKLLWDSSR